VSESCRRYLVGRLTEVGRRLPPAEAAYFGFSSLGLEKTVCVTHITNGDSVVATCDGKVGEWHLAPELAAMQKARLQPGDIFVGSDGICCVLKVSKM